MEEEFYIKRALSKDFSFLQTFILPYEHYAVQLCSYLRHKDSAIYIVSKTEKINTPQDIWGFFYFNKALLHCLPYLNDKNYKKFSDSFIPFLSDQPVKTIIGKKEQTELLLKILKPLKVTPSQCNYYKIMTLTDSPCPPPQELTMNEEIKRCTIDDQELLFDLQKKYITKEVAPAGKKVSDLECSIGLKDILKNQLVLALCADDEIVCKANTNAIGFNWVQLGGIYTHPLYRKNYYAWHLINYLCQRILKTQKTVCLFVKEKNIPALSLYQKIGFEEKENFEIAYF